MKSELPKPLHRVCGRSLLEWVLDAVDGVEPEHVALVVGHGKDEVRARLGDAWPERTFVWAEQQSQRGTGDATQVGLRQLDLVDGGMGDDDVLVTAGDTPLLRPETLAGLVAAHRETGAAATLLTARVPDPFGLGRIMRDPNGRVIEIVEERDASDEQRRVDEINSGVYCFRRSLLAPALRLISTDNAQGELYLTSVIEVLVEAGHAVRAFQAEATEVAGVNDRAQLAQAEAVVQDRILEHHLRSGVSIERPGSVVVEATVSLQADAMILAGSTLRGATTVGAGAVVGPASHLVDAVIGEGAEVHTSTVRNASVAAQAAVGPGAVIEG